MKTWPRLTAFLRRALLALAVLATLLALGIVVENLRGDRAWAAVERDLRARGEPLDLAAFKTPHVPDERNFFKAPALENLLYARSDDPQNKKLLAEAKLSEIASALGGRTLEEALKILLKAKVFAGPPSSDPAADILAAMQYAQPLLDAVVQAARERPDAWLAAELAPPFSSDQRLLDVSAALNIARALAGRTKARLSLGQTDAASADTKAILTFSAAISAATPTTLLHVLVAEAMRVAAADALKDGCTRHLWTEPQLAELQSLFQAYSGLVPLRRALQTERIWTTQMLDSPPPFDPIEVIKSPSLLSRRLIRGWAQQNKVSASRNLDALLAAFDPAVGRIDADRVQAVVKSGNALRNSRSPYVVIFKNIGGGVASAVEKFGTSENKLRLAVAACALERHRLARGSYPVTLTELVPVFFNAVPLDTFTGQSLGYTRTPDGGFTLTATSHWPGSETWSQPGAR